MIQPVGDTVVQAVMTAVAEGKAIDYGTNQDKEHPAISWQVVGLIETNEIAVVASCGEVSFGIKGSCPVKREKIVARSWGMDGHDANLADQLSNQLWEVKGDFLIDEVRRIEGLGDLKPPSADSWH